MPTVRLPQRRPYVLSFPEDDYIGLRILRSGRPYERHLLGAVRGIARSGVIVDVGANVGNHAIYWAVAGATVRAYEPNPIALEWLRLNVDANGLEARVHVRAVAVGARGGHASIAGTFDGNLGATSVRADSSGGLEMVALDDEGLGRVAVVKIDVEGGECDVLRGAERLLANRRPVVVMEAFTSAGSDLLRRYGYHRLPIPFARATHIYAFGWIGVVRVAAVPSVALNGTLLILSHSRVRVRNLLAHVRSAR